MKKEVVDSMTLQEVVDYAVKKIVEQGRQCMNESGCCYMNGLGDRCVVSWLLDEENEQLMNFEGGVGSLSNSKFSEFVPNLLKQKVHVFKALQGFHDKYSQDGRLRELSFLADCGIDISGDHFQKWVEMGVE